MKTELWFLQILVLTSMVAASTWASESGLVDGGGAISIDRVVAEANTCRTRGALCGPLSALRLICKVDAGVRLSQLTERFPDLADDGVRVGSVVEALRPTFPKARVMHFSRKNDLFHWGGPLILLVRDGRHCVVLEGVDEKTNAACVWDPSTVKVLRVARETVIAGWGGEAIVTGDAPAPSSMDNAIALLGLAGNAILAWGYSVRTSKLQLPPRQDNSRDAPPRPC